MHINIWGVHHDEQFWPEPAVFRPERFLAGAAEAEGRHPNAFLGFGVGERLWDKHLICTGLSGAS